MKIFACFPSKYLKAADLCGKHVSAIMSHVALEEVRGDADEAKLLPVLYFQGVPKGIVLNKTNCKVIAPAYGEETEAWSGKPIVLFSAMVAYGSEVVDAIRLKIPAPRYGGPTARDRQTAIIAASPDPAAAAEAMVESWSQTQSDRMRSAMRSPSPEPAARVLSEMLARPQHDADGVVWDEKGERAHTAEEKAELSMSLQRANAALDERRAREAAKSDGLDIPGFLQRGTPKPANGTPVATNGTGEYHPYSWIEDMQGVA